MAGVGHLRKICKDGFRVAGAVQETPEPFLRQWSETAAVWSETQTGDMFIRDVERGCILEHQIFRFAKMILRDRSSTSYDPASVFRGRRNILNRWNGKIATRIGTRPSALPSTFHFWKKSRRIVFGVVNLKIEEVSQNSCDFDVVKFKNWVSLAELLRFWCCQVQKLRKPRRIASFFKLVVDRQIDRNIDRQTDRQIDR